MREYSIRKAAEEVQANKSTACEEYVWFREVRSTRLLILIGGQGVIVQVNKSMFCLFHVLFFHGRYYFSTSEGDPRAERFGCLE